MSEDREQLSSEVEALSRLVAALTRAVGNILLAIEQEALVANVQAFNARVVAAHRLQLRASVERELLEEVFAAMKLLPRSMWLVRCMHCGRLWLSGDVVGWQHVGALVDAVSGDTVSACPVCTPELRQPDDDSTMALPTNGLSFGRWSKMSLEERRAFLGLPSGAPAQITKGMQDDSE